MQQNTEEYLKISDLAKILKVSTETLRRWEKLGKIKSYRLTSSGRRRYRLSEIAHLLEPNGDQNA